MTFTEAALEVLRSAGEPLHYKKITELAIAGNLLSHVGKTPEVTMSSRLATLVKKDRGQSPIIKVKPGVFALRESSMQTDKDSSTETSSSEQPASVEAAPETVPVVRPPLPGADVFPEEADDDFPILAGLEEEQTAEGGRRRRRRRRRGGKGGAGEPMAADPIASAPRRDGPPRDVNRQEPPRHDRDAGRRDMGRPDRDPMRNNNRREREPRGRDEQQPELDFSRQPAEGDLLGKDLADAAYHVLSRGDRAPASFPRVADMLVRRGRLSGSPDALAPTVAAALRADAARAERAHGRPRFRISGQRVSLTEWLLPREASRSEEAVEHNAEAQREQVQRAFIARVNDLPAAGFAELLATWLNAEGVTSLRAVRRPGSSGREFHFAGTLRRGAEENRLAFVVLRSGRDIDRETVVEARGSLHHYGGATGAWLVTTGRINATAREECSAEGAAPCALFGGADLARAMERLGIGLRVHYVALSDVDFDLLESLGDNVQPPIRRDREDRPAFDRPRDRERERRPQQEVAATPVAETPDANRFDLFDPEAAEASRLVPEAQTWNPSETDDESELETRSTVRVAPPIRIGADEPEGENAPEQHAAAETGPEPDDSTVGDDDSDELDTEASSSSES